MPTSLSSESSVSFADAPLDSLLDKKVHEMNAQELADYVKRCAVLRSSAATRKAALKSEGGAAKPKKKKQSRVERALVLLARIPRNESTNDNVL
jgi:hypothetical protein